jgi:predicted benzoate:H+ symporter BenE
MFSVSMFFLAVLQFRKLKIPEAKFLVPDAGEGDIVDSGIGYRNVNLRAIESCICMQPSLY